MPAERRRHRRYLTPPMYHPVTVRRAGEATFVLDGHAYDLSEGGIHFELDEPIKPGQVIEILFPLPGAVDGDPSGTILAVGTVAWSLGEDPDEPGPVRMAVAFDSFPRPGDRERLAASLRPGRLRAAA